MNLNESLLDKNSEFIVDLKEDLGLYVVHLEKHPSNGVFHLPRNSEFELAMVGKASVGISIVGLYILAHL